jgi:hypothetical protein
MNGNSFLIIPLDVSVLAAVFLCVLPLVWAGVCIRQTFENRRAKSKPPFDDLKRPAGEAARLQVVALDEKINDLI